MLLFHRHVYAVYVYEDPVHKVKSINLSLHKLLLSVVKSGHLLGFIRYCHIVMKQRSSFAIIPPVSSPAKRLDLCLECAL
jgi:hypothetical protein